MNVKIAEIQMLLATMWVFKIINILILNSKHLVEIFSFTTKVDLIYRLSI